MANSKPPSLGRLPRRVGSVLLWTVLVLVGAFGVVFSFANYPVVASVLVVGALLLTVYSERTRQAKRRASEKARRRNRLPG